MSNEHYFAAQPASELNLRTFHARLVGQVYELTTASGIFSPERVDAGTEVLLANTPAPPPGGQPARPRLRLGTDRPQSRHPFAASDGVGGRCERARAGPRAPECPVAGPRQRQRLYTRQCSHRCDVHDDLVQSAHPSRARTNCTGCSSAGFRGSSPVATRGWWCSATWVRTRCSAGSRRRTPTTSRSPAQRPTRATGCCGDAIAADRAVAPIRPLEHRR